MLPSQDPRTFDCWNFTETASIATILDHNDVTDMPLLATMQKYPKRVLYILLMIPAILLVGYNLVIAGALASMPYFDLIYGESNPDPTSALGVSLFIPATWLGLWNGLGSLGTMFGAGFAGWVQDRFGRRISLGLGAVIALLGIVIIYLSSSYPTADGKRAIFLLGKVFEGFAIGQTAATTQTYISEIAPNSLLGPVSAFFPAVILTGQLIGARIVFGEIYVVADWGYKTCMLSMFPFAGAVVLISFIMPESPTWLVRMGRATAARAAIKRLERAEHDIEDVIYDLVVVMGKEKKECGNGNVSIMQCFKGADARRTRIIILANTMTNMFGVTFLNTATYFYEMLGMEPGIAITMLELGIGVGILSNFISVWTMTKFSRRPLMIGTFTIISILWFAIGVTGFFPISKEINYLSAGCLMVVIFVSGLGVWPASVAVSSEASSLRLRGQTQAIGWVWQNLVSGGMGIVLPYIYTPNQGNSGELIGFLFFGLSFIGAMLAWLYVPEMKGRTPSEINAMFQEGVSTTGFKKWKSKVTAVPEPGNRGSRIHVDRGRASVYVQYGW